MNKEALKKIYDALVAAGAKDSDRAGRSHSFFYPVDPSVVRDPGQVMQSVLASYVPNWIGATFPEGAKLGISLGDYRSMILPAYIPQVRITQGSDEILNLTMVDATTVVNGEHFHVPKIKMESQLTRMSVKDQLLMRDTIATVLKEIEPARRRPHHRSAPPPYELLYVLADVL